MKKIFFILSFFTLFLLNISANALGIIRFTPTAYIYSGINFPLDVAKAGGFSNRKEKEIISVSNKNVKKSQITKTEQKQIIIGSAEKDIKSGISTRTNILGLVETGDAGICKAAKNGHISKIHYVDYKIEEIYIPLGFIPIYFNTYITTVYGE